MANYFKDYKAKINNTRKNSLTDEELCSYSKTVNNEGVSHEHRDWDIASKEIVSEFDEKDKTIKRDWEREQKIKNMSEENI